MMKRLFIPIVLILATGLLQSERLPTVAAAGVVLYLPGDSAAGPAAFNQDEPHLAAGGNQSLVAWSDFRTGGSSLIIAEGGADIFAARLDSTGDLIDTIPIALSQDAGDQTHPQVAWNGTNWLVAWHSMTPNQFFWSSEIQGVRVSPAGQVLDPVPISIFKYPFSNGADFALASDGDGWAVVTRGTSAGENDLVGVQIAADGSLPDPNGVVIASGTFQLAFNLQLAFSVDEYLFTYLLGSQLLGIRLDSNLQKIDQNPFAIATGSGLESPRLASNGAAFFAVWRIYNNGTQWGEARGSRISLAGQVLDPGGLSLSGMLFIGAVDPRVAWDGTNWVTSFKAVLIGPGDPDTTFAARVTTGGTVLDPGGVNIEPVGTGYPEIELAGAPGGGTQIVWKDNRAGGPFPDDISGFRLTTDLSPSAPSVLSFGAPAQLGTASAAGGDSYMLAFVSAVSGMNRIMAHPLDADGVPILSAPVMLGQTPDLVNVSVAWNGSVYLVAWADVGVGNLNNSQVYFRRLDANGTPIDPAPVALMEGFSTDVAAAGDVFLVVAIQQTLTAEIHEPFGARVDGATGTILDPTPIDLGDSFAGLPGVSALGSGWIVTYQRNFTHDDPHADIRATVVSAAGTITNSYSVATGLGPFYYDPDVASDGVQAAVIWEDAGSHDINGAMVDASGVNVGTFVVSGAPETQDHPAIGWNGNQYQSLFMDQRNKTFFIDQRSDVYGTGLDAAGTVLDPGGIGYFTGTLSEIDPAVSGVNGGTLIAAAVYVPGQAAYRIGYLPPNGVPATGYTIYLPIVVR